MLALSKILCRPLVLPGFFVRFGSRLTRVSAFEERWLPTSHFFNLTALKQSFDVLELQECVFASPSSGGSNQLRTSHHMPWMRTPNIILVVVPVHRWLGTDEGRVLPLLNARAVASAPPQQRFFQFHNITFRSVQPSTFPHFLQQQSEMRWVSEDETRSGYFSRFESGFGPRWWRQKFGQPASRKSSRQDVLAFDSAVSIGMGMEYLRWDEAMRFTRGHLRYVGSVHAEAARVRKSLFADAPYLAVHIRRGADRLHDFCHTGWGKRCFGWNITMEMCYPTTEAVAAQILAAQKRWAVPDGNIFLATDSPRPELFEDILRERHGVAFARYGQQGPAPSLGEEFSLPVDQTICAAAPFFLGRLREAYTRANLYCL